MEENPCVTQTVDLMMMCAEKGRVCVCVCVLRGVTVRLSATSLKSHTRVLSQQLLPIANLSFF